MPYCINSLFLQELEKRRIYLRPHFHYGDAEGKKFNTLNEVLAENFSRIPESSFNLHEPIKIGAFSYIVQGSYLPNSIIGRYCSIATNVRIMSEGHPINRVTTSTLTYGNNISRIIKENFDVDIIQDFNIPVSQPTVIGNDVWIGESAVLKRGVKIGSGSIIAGYSVVTKDVPPYAIVGGNPAKLIRYRFDETTCMLLLKSKWWNYSPKAFKENNLSNVKTFLKNLKSYPEYIYEEHNITNLLKEFGNTP